MIRTVQLDNKTELDVSWLTLEEIPALTSDFRKNHYNDMKGWLNLIFGDIRPRVCLSCGEHFGMFDMHHALVSRQDVRGWRHKAKGIPAAKMRLLLITNEINCVPLHNSCHLANPPTREQAWEFQKAFYGKEVMLEWHHGLPWKTSRPPRLFD